jgi:hypothetical protein
MCDAVGHPVVRLRRVRIGPIADTRLKTGHWRELTDREIALLKRAAGLELASSEPSPRRTAERSRPTRRR